jgi:hypothetical protein
MATQPRMFESVKTTGLDAGIPRRFKSLPQLCCCLQAFQSCGRGSLAALSRFPVLDLQRLSQHVINVSDRWSPEQACVFGWHWTARMGLKQRWKGGALDTMELTMLSNRILRNVGHVLSNEGKLAATWLNGRGQLVLQWRGFCSTRSILLLMKSIAIWYRTCERLSRSSCMLLVC